MQSTQNTSFSGHTFDKRGTRSRFANHRGCHAAGTTRSYVSKSTSLLGVKQSGGIGGLYDFLTAYDAAECHQPDSNAIGKESGLPFLILCPFTDLQQFS
jgi:hypothetical protein